MGSLFQMIMAGIATPVVIIWIVMVHYYGNKFSEVIESINPEEYRYPELFGIGFGVMDLVHYDMTSERAVRQIKKIAEIKGKKYAAYYYYVMTGEKITYAATILPFVLLLSAMANSVEALIFGVLLTGMLIWYLNEVTKDDLVDRRDEILRDFPQVLSKLTLLVNSGMVLRDAWKNVADNANGILYEEMRVTCNEMNTGVSEMEAYQNFAERCEVKEIKRFTSSVIQNMMKGNSELTKFLKEMSDEMWNEKKNMVKRQGEAANSKLLLPTMMIFVGILIVIMVPMLTSM